MDDKTIFTKTAKGVSESVGKTKTLSRNLRDVLKEVDGTSSMEELANVLGMSGERLRETVTKLAAEDYIHEFVPPVVADDEFDLGPAPATPPDPLTEVTISAFLRAGKEQAQDEEVRKNEKERQLAEEEARREAEEELRRVAEQAKQAEERRAKREAEKQARREAKTRARKEASERSRHKAEQRAGNETQQRIEPVFSNTVQVDVGTRTATKAEHLAGEEHMQANAKAAGHRAAKRSRKSADRDAARSRAASMAEERVVSIETRKPYDASRKTRFWPFGTTARRPAKWRKPIAVAGSIALIAGTAIALTTSYDGKAARFASLATAQFGQPVTIGKVRLALLPQPHWRLEDVTIGTAGQIKLARVDAMASFGSLFGEQAVYRSVVLTSPVINEEGLGWLMFKRSASQKDSYRFEEISATNVKLASNTIDLPAFNIDADFYDDGNWKTVAIDSEDKTFHANLKPQRDSVQVDLIADNFTPPFGAAMKFDTFQASGSATRSELSLTKFGGKMLGGFIDGSASVKWTDSWKLEGNVKITQINMPPVAPHLLEGGKLDGSVNYAMEAPSADQLLPTLRQSGRLNGNITIHNGALLGVNLASMLRGISTGGRSTFTALTSEITQERGRMHLRNLHSNEGAMSVNGNVDVDMSNKLNGRFAITLKTTTRQTRASMGLGGTLDAPQFHP